MESLFLVGDFKSNNGPGNANKAILNALKTTATTSHTRACTKLARIFEMFVGVYRFKTCVICSSSRSNYILIWLAKHMHRKIIYIMHGCGSMEYLINEGNETDNDYKKIYEYEDYIFSNVDKVVCVSKKFMDVMKDYRPQYKNKFSYIYNIVNVNNIKKNSISHTNVYKNSANMYILSVGGGIKGKRNLLVAKAIDYINKKNEYKINYVVVGPLKQEGEKIREYDFVKYFEELDHDVLLDYMKNADLYIQNSVFETFGLAIIEALYMGTNLLIEEDIGCGDLFEDKSEFDLILREDSEFEIAKKIEYIIHHPNNIRLRESFRYDEITDDAIVKKIMNILAELG